MGEVIGIVSGKGGVGKTTTAANLGACLATFNKNTILVDGNLTTPNLSLHLGITLFPYTLHHVIANEIELEDAIFYHDCGLKIIPSSISLHALRKINLDRFSDVLAELKKRAEYIIVDSSPGLGKETQSVIENSDEVLVVLNPEMPAVTDALKVVRLAEHVGTKIKGVVVNKVKGQKHELTKEEIEEILEYPVIGVVPDDNRVRLSVLEKNPVVFAYPYSPAALKFKEIAGKIAGIEERVKERMSIWERILAFLTGRRYER